MRTWLCVRGRWYFFRASSDGGGAFANPSPGAHLQHGEFVEGLGELGNTTLDTRSGKGVSFPRTRS